jgi:hypothetical protein
MYSINCNIKISACSTQILMQMYRCYFLWYSMAWLMTSIGWHVALLTWLINMNINKVVLTVNKRFFAVLHNTTECTILNSDLSLYTVFHHHWYWYLIWHRMDDYGTWISPADCIYIFFYFNLMFSTEVLKKTVHWRRKEAFGSDRTFSSIGFRNELLWTRGWSFMCFQIDLPIVWRKLYKDFPFYPFEVSLWTLNLDNTSTQSELKCSSLRCHPYIIAIETSNVLPPLVLVGDTAVAHLR